mmetsp:Transcript_35940/g.62132  ORF Transcript_35940/g.62132 Transcript_35940/m.62132 type:complete len:220 (-) Transcript_35940:45-704(-)|eukprot:CAMPEP_0205917352 /NCGR_PEP_ID=MMETSP1325-20131115/9104_1 /ASSEMBLY_ACC=CAM_ASM_000708 /TAXON_ID=236786 /ORGANISM="Florenciella sp., Strain RCC1007" /LENGTH=219 /DNA_ID=CAMNT_0053284757 /DNA_START=37 /DNA_END=696 /DNA_ORIENTATION=+
MLPSTSRADRHADARKSKFFEQLHDKEERTMRLRKRRGLESQQVPWSPEVISDTYRSNAFRPHTVPAPYIFDSMYTLSSGRKVGRTRPRGSMDLVATTPPASSEVDPWKSRVVPGFKFYRGPESRTSSQTGAWHQHAGHTPYVPIRVQKRYGGAVVANADLAHAVKKDIHQTPASRAVQKVFPKLCREDPSLEFVLESADELEKKRERLRTQLRELESR